MDQVAPLGPVYQAGTLAGNPLAMRAGIAALQQLTKPGLYEEVTALAQRLASGLRAQVADAGIPAQINAIGPLAHDFLCIRAGEKLQRCETLGRQEIRQVFSRDARSGHILGAITVRGCVCLHGAHAAGY